MYWNRTQEISQSINHRHSLWIITETHGIIQILHPALAGYNISHNAMCRSNYLL